MCEVLFFIVGFFSLLYGAARLAGRWFITKKKAPELPWHS
jgi:hypothetical protein